MDGNLEANKTLNNLKGKIVSLPKIDKTLSKSGQAADAKVTGDLIAGLTERIAALEQPVTAQE